MKSIQARLTVTLLGTTIGIILASAAALCVFLVLGSNRQLDRAIDGQTMLLSAAVEVKSDGQIKFDQVPAFGERFHNEAYPRDFFEIWRPDGTVMFRSASLGCNDLPFHPVGSRPVVFDQKLPNSRAARMRVSLIQPRLDDDLLMHLRAIHRAQNWRKPGKLILALAHDRHDIDAQLRNFAVGLLVMALGVAIVVACVAAWAVRKALQPLRQIGTDADAIDETALSHRFVVDDRLPSELMPISARLNDLLGRLQRAFERERQFTANAAHELRTPIAELQTMTEVVLKWPPGADALRKHLSDSLQVARQMGSIVNALLQLARYDAGWTAALSAVRLRDALEEAWQPYQSEAEARGLQVIWEVTFDAVVTTDRTILVQILANLFSNASRYARRDTQVTCTVHLAKSGTVITLANEAELLSQDDLPRIFEPFWRKDSARFRSGHSGLGLSIVEAYAKLLGHRLSAQLENGIFNITLEIANGLLYRDSACEPEQRDKRAFQIAQSVA